MKLYSKLSKLMFIIFVEIAQQVVKLFGFFWNFCDKQIFTSIYWNLIKFWIQNTHNKRSYWYKSCGHSLLWGCTAFAFFYVNNKKILLCKNFYTSSFWFVTYFELSWTWSNYFWIVYPDISWYLIVFKERHLKDDTLVLPCPKLFR